MKEYDEKMKIGQKIKNLRKQHNMTQRELSKQLRVTSQAISKWEHGKNMPDICILPDIARCFAVSMDELFEYSFVNGK